MYTLRMQLFSMNSESFSPHQLAKAFNIHLAKMQSLVYGLVLQRTKVPNIELCWPVEGQKRWFCNTCHLYCALQRACTIRGVHYNEHTLGIPKAEFVWKRNARHSHQVRNWNPPLFMMFDLVTMRYLLISVCSRRSFFISFSFFYTTSFRALFVLVDISSLRKFKSTVFTGVRPFLMMNSTYVFW